MNYNIIWNCIIVVGYDIVVHIKVVTERNTKVTPSSTIESETRRLARYRMG